MSELSKEQLETIWRVLYPEHNPNIHKMCGINDPQNSLYYKCRKCGIDKMGIPLTQRIQTEPCPIPDKLPKSLAEVAEDIRVWMADQCWEVQYKYFDAVESGIKDVRGNRSLDGYVLFYATPLDKITAFCNIHDTKEDGE